MFFDSISVGLVQAGTDVDFTILISRHLAPTDSIALTRHAEELQGVVGGAGIANTGSAW